MTARPSQPTAADPALQLWLAHEDRLFGLAYRMLGSVTDAQDVLQEAFLRLRAADPAALRRPGGWLTTVVTRLCLDHLASARVRRERYVGPWLPEPVTTAPDVADDVVLAESISAAFLVVLEALSPAERAAFVLHDVFGHPFSEVAGVLGRDEAACRQLASRARRAIRNRPVRFAADPEQRQAVTQRFLDACAGHDLTTLLEVLAPEVTLHNDGGGKVRAARRIVTGADRVARFLVGVLTRRTEWTPTKIEVHGASGLLWHDPAGTPAAVLSSTVDDQGRIATVSMVVNPEKLRHLTARRASPDAAGRHPTPQHLRRRHEPS
jgi:RNA polymerase sigma-70 factor, ECF subfamily